MNILRRSAQLHYDPVGLYRVMCPVMLAFVLLFGYSTAAFAAESGKLVEKDGKYVFVESMDPSMRLLLERSVKSGILA